MMMPSTMILTICISMVLKHNVVYHWTLGLVMREQNTQNS